MASQVPCLASDVGALKEMIGETGWIFKKESPEDLAEKLLKIMKNKSILKTKSYIARERVINNFSQEKMLQEYEKNLNNFK